MRQLHSYKADDRDPLVLIFDRDLPNWPSSYNEKIRRRFWDQEARTIVNFLYKCLPGGLVDHIFAELALRHASVFVVPHVAEDKET